MSNLPKSKKTAAGGSDHRLVRWRVSGVCLVPNEVEVFVWAETKAGAERAAIRKFRESPCSAIVGNSADEGSAYDFHPTAEECAATLYQL